MFSNLFKSKKNTKEEFYFGLILKEEEGSGMIIGLDESRTNAHSIDEKKFTYSNGWEGLLEDVDQVLYDLEQRNSVTLKKVIFFLYSHLIDQSNKQIKKIYARRIKNIADELTIEPLGFIEYHEAIAQRQSEKDEAPLTAIIVELDKPFISVFIYKGGELFFSDSIGKTEDIVSDLETIFTKIKGTVLPARIILYDATSLIAESHKIVTHKFNDDLFIQLPKVEILRESDVIDSLLHSFSGQFDDDVNAKKLQQGDESETMGFLIGEDIQEKDEPEPDPQNTTHKHNLNASEEFTFKESQKKPNFLQKILSSVYVKFNKPNYGQNNETMKINLGILSAIGFFLIICSFFLILYFFHKANLTIYYEGKREQKEMMLTGSIGKSKTPGNSIEIKKAEKKVESTDTIDTTGKKTIGQKATGAVTLYNKDTGDKTFKKGEVLTSQAGIKFLLDSDVKVASASESLTSEGNVLTVTGKAKGQVTAAEIGPTGNLPKGEKLKIGDFSQSLFFALVESPFTGGSKEDIKTVSKEDIATLDKKVTDKMKQEKETIQEASSSDHEKRIDVLSEASIQDKAYSKEVGEEAESLTIHAKGKITVYKYNDTTLKDYIVKEFKTTIPKDYDLHPTNVSYTISNAVKKDDGTIAFTLRVQAKLVPKYDDMEIKGFVTGRTENSLNTILKDRLHAKGFKMEVDTPLPFLKSRLPFFKQNIRVSIDSL